MKKTIALIIITCFVRTLIAQDATAIYKNTVNSTVTIETDIMIGSGFFVSKDLIVTNFHVIDGASEAYCYTNNSSTKFRIEGYVAVDKSADLIILKVSGLNRDAIKIATNSVSPGQKIFVIGSPKGLPASISDGIVSGLRDFNGIKLIQISAPISSGSSGGPVLNENGELIGISVGQIEDGQNLNFAIPISNLENLLNLRKSVPHSITSLYSVISSFTDPRDGQSYKTVRIGEQTWMAENLKTTKLNDGTLIPYVTFEAVVHNLVTPGYAWYNDDSSFRNSYGALYNWYTVNTGKLCPKGWHVPTEKDWNKLVLYLDDNAVDDTTEANNITSRIAGGKLKFITGWENPNTGANNESGFAALPAGYRICNGAYVNMGKYGFWWSATEAEASFGGHFALYHYLFYNDTNISRHFSEKLDAYSVRCIKY